MSDFLTGTSCVFAFFAGLLWLLAIIRRRWRLHPEICRKAAHVMMGLACLSLPGFVTSTWQILTLAACFIAGLAWMRRSHSASIAEVDVFRQSRRHSTGEFYFVAGVAVAFILADGDRFAYSTSVLVLACADAASGAAGRLLGRTRCWGNGKTAEGSLAFLSVAALCLLVAVRLTGCHPGFSAGILLCLCATAAEGLTTRGSDNFWIPLTCMVCFRLQGWLPFQPDAGLAVALAAGGLGVLASRTIRRSPAF